MSGDSRGRRRPGRLRGVDGLRAVAAGSVLLYHVWKGAAPDGRPMTDLAVAGSVVPHLRHGVTLFFVLSGFLLFRPFASAVIRNAPLPRIRSYFVNRALRILPAYWVILVVIGLVLDAAVLRGPDGNYYTGELSLAQLLLCATLLQNYTEDSLFMGIGPAWSLAVEAVWYLVLPLLALLAARAARDSPSASRRTHAALLPVALMLAVAITGKVAGVKFVGWTAGVESSFWSTADFFAYGMIVAVLSVAVERERLALASWWRPAAALAGVLLVLAAAFFGTTNLEPALGRTYASNVAFAMACALLLSLVVLPHARTGFDTRLVRSLDSRAFTAVGLASYSLFLWHEPIAFWLRRHDMTADGWLGFGWNLLAVTLISGALAALTYRWIERPALRLKRTWAGRPRPDPSPEQVRAAP
jgi:peptidoglycan/LPS O-acetylase OafA/YrhL